MAATFAFDEDHGVATGSPTRGTTTSAGVTEVNWKNIDDSTTAYSASPIAAGSNSFEKWQFGHFSGTYNQILNGLFAHTAGTFPTGCTLKGTPVGSSQLVYTTPAVTTNATLTTDMTTAIAITSGVAVYFGPTGPATVSKTTSTTSNPAYTNYLTTQLQTTGSAPAGDIPSITLTLRYDEN